MSADASEARYGNFSVAVYCRAQEVREMKDPAWLESRWDLIARQVKIDKVYIETHRDMILVDEATIAKARKFFESRGIRTAGGITLTVNERNRFQTFCYTNPEHRARVRRIAEHTARLFDEVILDDFFFTNCKCESCIAAKKDRGWTEFRLGLMEEAARDLVIGPARAVNPRVKLVIKYPNWYEHYQGLGYNLEAEPPIFDAVYTGTETRDPVMTQQHLQQYQSYLIFRYLENVKPGGNGGGWVDTAGIRSLDRYAEQLWLTLFAKAPEITLFDLRQLLDPVHESLRSAWQGSGTSFDFDAMMQSDRQPGAVTTPRTTMARAAGYTFEKVDAFLGKLGRPVGVKSYKPYHSTGEDFLHNFLGMIGVPMDIQPEFPSDAPTVFLSESAGLDATITAKIQTQLQKGKTVVITSGLLRALQGKGIEDIVELEHTGMKAAVGEFVVGWSGGHRSRMPILIPQIKYLTNDSWEEISGLAGGIGYPLLHQVDYAEGRLYVLTIPENFGDLYGLPVAVLDGIRATLSKDLGIRLEGPSQVSLIAYDNGTFIVESFLPEAADVTVVVDRAAERLRDLVAGEAIPARKRQRRIGRTREIVDNVFDVRIKPHSYRVFEIE
ncbi:MAG: hypothetical protein JXO72_03940 [Vicinamibacteria bacterium]|nr:hypothetical protein [Vicinamibacteria bacterium]